eukprot:Pgem_evm1s11077
MKIYERRFTFPQKMVQKQIETASPSVIRHEQRHPQFCSSPKTRMTEMALGEVGIGSHFSYIFST